MAELKYVDAVQKLEAGDSFTLQDMKNLSYADLDKLFEEIKHWKVYGNINTKINAVKREWEPYKKIKLTLLSILKIKRGLMVRLIKQGIFRL